MKQRQIHTQEVLKYITSDGGVYYKSSEAMVHQNALDVLEYRLSLSELERKRFDEVALMDAQEYERMKSLLSSTH